MMWLRQAWWRVSYRLFGPRPSPKRMAEIRSSLIEQMGRLQPHAAASPPRRRRRRKAVAVGVAAALLGATGAAAAVLINRSHPSVQMSSEARAGIEESPTLANAPWLYQSDGASHIDQVTRRSSIRFPPGTTYAQALQRLMRSVLETGTLPKGVIVEPPLAEHVVWQRGTKVTGPRLDLTAPWGFALPSGLIRTPSLQIASWVPLKEDLRITRAIRDGRPIGLGRGKGITADVPRLPRCQIQGVRGTIPACNVRRPRGSRS